MHSTIDISYTRPTELSCAKFNTQMLVIQNWNIQAIGTTTSGMYNQVKLRNINHPSHINLQRSKILYQFVQL